VSNVGNGKSHKNETLPNPVFLSYDLDETFTENRLKHITAFMQHLCFVICHVCGEINLNKYE